MTQARSLATVSRGRDNNLNLLRLLAATAVVYGHAFGTVGRTATEPFYRLFGIGTGDVGVDVFFTISGFLIAKSLASRDLVHFVWARVMRIFPGLWVSSVVLVLVAGLGFSPLPAREFWLRHDTWAYVLRNGTMLPGIGCQTWLPFAFDNSTLEFNASLWTLPHELQMYMLLAALGVLGLLRWPAVAAAVALLGGVAFALGVFDVVHLLDTDRARFIFFFFTGATCYALREQITMRSSVALVCVLACLATAWLTSNHAVHRLVLAATLPYAVLWLGFVPGGAIRAYNRVGDYSYGTYILAGPVQLVLAHRFAVSLPLDNFRVALLIVLPAAALSWHFLESRALALALPRLLARLPRLRVATTES
jgi:peptidoglycan/LPS O-acetylase OafA/YrhL